MAIKNGVLTAPLRNPENEGKTVALVLYKELNNCRTIATTLRNVLAINDTDSLMAKLEAAVATLQAENTEANRAALLGVLTEKFSVSGVSGITDGSYTILEIAEHYFTERGAVNALIDCGVNPDFSNLQEVLKTYLNSKHVTQGAANMNAILTLIGTLKATLSANALIGIAGACAAMKQPLRDAANSVGAVGA